MLPGLQSSAKTFTLVIKGNTSPPLFQESLPKLTVMQGNKTRFIIPTYADPDGDSIEQPDFKLNDAISFITIIQDGLGLMISPSNLTQPRTYIVKITLTDKNKYSMSKTYSLQIAVTPLPIPIIVKNDTAPSKKPKTIGI